MTAMKYLILLYFALIIASSFADEPLPLPQSYEFCHVHSPDICAYVDTETGTTLQYRDEAGELRRWHVAAWYRHIELANDGKHLVTLYDGASLLTYNDNKADTVMLELWRAPHPSERAQDENGVMEGQRVRRVSLGELVAEMENLRPTVSHWYWGDMQRLYIFVQSEGTEEELRLVDRLELETVEGRIFYFDMLTGELEAE